MSGLTRARICAILDSIPRIPEKHKQRVSWEILAELKQLQLWPEENSEGAKNPSVRKNHVKDVQQ